MTSRWLAILALVMLAVALAILAHFAPRGDARNTFPISSLAGRDVRLIRVEHGTRLTAVLAHEGGRWRLTAPLEVPADAFQVDRILAILSARSPQRMAPTELGRFELDPASLRVAFDDQVLHFGMVNAVTQEQYVLTGDALYVIDPRYGAALPVDALQLAEHRIFPDDAVLVHLTLPDFSLVRGEAGWTMMPPHGRISQDDLNRFADDWRVATATRVTRATARTALGTVRIQLKDGEEIEFDIVERDSALVLRRSRLNIEYVFTEASARRMLSVPGRAAH